MTKSHIKPASINKLAQVAEEECCPGSLEQVESIARSPISVTTRASASWPLNRFDVRSIVCTGCSFGLSTLLFNGHPQPGHDSAFELTPRPHSGHLIIAMNSLLMKATATGRRIPPVPPRCQVPDLNSSSSRSASRCSRAASSSLRSSAVSRSAHEDALYGVGPSRTPSAPSCSLPAWPPPAPFAQGRIGGLVRSRRPPILPPKKNTRNRQNPT